MFATIQQIFSDLFHEKTRMILTILAIAWGSFAISIMLAIGQGLRTTFSTAVANAGHNLLIVTGGETSKSTNGTKINKTIKLTRKDYLIISKLPSIKLISPIYKKTVTMKAKKNSLTKTIQAVNNYYDKIHEISIQSKGHFISPLDIKKSTKVIVLGNDVKNSLFPYTQNVTGKTIKVDNIPFLVIGTMQQKSQLAASREPDSILSWIPETTYKQLSNTNIINNIAIQYRDSAQLEYLKKQIQNIIALNHHVSANDESIVQFKDIAKKQQTINTFFFGMEIFLGIIGFLTLFVAAIGVANVMYASISRATYEIGIRMAVGARTYQILFKYIIESLLATLFGGGLGLIAAILTVAAIDTIPMHGKLISVIGKPHAVLSIGVILIVISILGLVGIITGLFPAIKAANIDPSEALTYE